MSRQKSGDILRKLSKDSDILKKEVFYILGAMVTVYYPDEISDKTNSPLPATVLCPGGAYQIYGVYEGLPVVKKLCSSGFCTFLISYGIGQDAANGLPLRQISRTVAHIRKNSEHFNIDPEKIFVMGFSAGGHLAASLGTLWNHPFLSEDEGMNRPDALCLCYPVISLEKFPHLLTNQMLLSGDDNNKFLSLLSAEKNVNRDTPPVFLWHGSDDKTVSVNHSLIFAEALKENNVPYSLKIFDHTVHGCGLAEKGSPFEDAEVSEWFSLWLSFLDGLYKNYTFGIDI